MQYIGALEDTDKASCQSLMHQMQMSWYAGSNAATFERESNQFNTLVAKGKARFESGATGVSSNSRKTAPPPTIPGSERPPPSRDQPSNDTLTQG
jgi:hypothetical protein